MGTPDMNWRILWSSRVIRLALDNIHFATVCMNVPFLVQLSSVITIMIKISIFIVG